MTAWRDLYGSREWGTGVRWDDLDAFAWAEVPAREVEEEPDALDAAAAYAEADAAA